MSGTRSGCRMEGLPQATAPADHASSARASGSTHGDISPGTNHVLTDHRPKYVGNINQPVGSLVVLQDDDESTTERHGRAVERVDEASSLVTGGTVPDIQSPCLIVAAIGCAGHFTVL